MQGYDPRVDAAELVRRHGPEKAQQIIAAFMRDRGMSDRNSEIWSGLDVRTAQRGMEPADLSDGMAGAPQTQVGDDATLAGEDGSGRDWGNWKPGMPMPSVGGGGMRSGDDSQRGPGYQRVPGPRTLDGKPTAPGDVMYDPKAIEQYTTRQQDPETGLYAPSPKDRDMQRRGMVPVTNPDGSVSYSVAYSQEPGGAAGRAGERRDLEEAGWTKQTVPGPTGPQTVYRPGEAVQAKYDDYRRERQLFRQAEAAGMTPDELIAADPSWEGVGSAREGGATRRLVEANRANARQDRAAKWRAQMMLAGANPRKNMVNAWSMMEDPGVSDAQRRSLQYMLPGGQLTAEVDARANQQAFELAKQMALGAGFQDHSSPAAQAALTAKAAQAQEALPPEAAAEAERASNGGVLPANSSAGQRMLKKIEQETIGPFALQSEVDTAVEAAIAAGVPRADAEKFFAPRRKNWNEWWGFGQQPGQPPAGVTPGSVPPI